VQIVGPYLQSSTIARNKSEKKKIFQIPTRSSFTIVGILKYREPRKAKEQRLLVFADEDL